MNSVWLPDKFPHITRMMRLCDGPPRPRAAFPIPPKTYWVYRIQQRVWIKFQDGREEWSDWMTVVIPYYIRRRAAERAMEKWAASFRQHNVMPHREFRVHPVEHPTGKRYTPAKRRR